MRQQILWAKPVRGSGDPVAGGADRCMVGSEALGSAPDVGSMIPTLVPEPLHRPGWVYEEKVDGYRMLAYREGKRVRLVSLNDVDHSKRFPELVGAATLPGRALVLDGEVAVFDRQLRSRFVWLRETDAEDIATPPLLMVFDLMYRNSRDLSQRPLLERHQRLAELVEAGADRILPVRRLASNGLAAWTPVVAKDETSAYGAGKTSRWLKVKVPG